MKTRFSRQALAFAIGVAGVAAPVSARAQRFGITAGWAWYRMRLFVGIGSAAFVMAFGACRSERLNVVGEFPPNPCGELVAICVQPGTANMRVGDTLTIHAIEVFVSNPRFKWTSSDSINVKVDSAARVRAAGVSSGAGVCATGDGGSACATVTVVP